MTKTKSPVNLPTDSAAGASVESVAAAIVPPAENPPLDPLALLQNRAQLLGVAYDEGDDVDTLRQKIKDAVEGKVPVASAPAPQQSLTKAQKMAAKRQQMYLEQMRLVRLRITNLNPTKADLTGEIFSFSNKYLGTVRRFVPYGEATDNGWHLPWCIYQELLAREFVQLNVRSGPKGESKPNPRWVKEFALEVMTPLTAEELRVLANKQAAAAGLAV